MALHDVDNRLTRCVNRLNRCLKSKIRLSVLDNNSVTAYAWPNGHLYVTHGLVECMNDDELSAAIAHEVGHLLDHGKLQAVRALNSSSTPLDDEEARADLIGCDLLEAQGIATNVMAKMLQKVVDVEDLSPAGRKGLERRIAALYKTLGSETPDNKLPPIDYFVYATVDYEPIEPTLLRF